MVGLAIQRVGAKRGEGRTRTTLPGGQCNRWNRTGPQSYRVRSCSPEGTAAHAKELDVSGRFKAPD
jgi:hypothetical protein